MASAAPPAMEHPPAASDVGAGPLPQAGDKVEAYWYGAWYPAVVHSIQGDIVVLLWTGEHSSGMVPLHCLRPLPAASPAEPAPAEVVEAEPPVLIVATVAATEDDRKAGTASPHLSAMSTCLDVPIDWEERLRDLVEAEVEEDAASSPGRDTPPLPPRRPSVAQQVPVEASGLVAEAVPSAAAAAAAPAPAPRLLGAWKKAAEAQTKETTKSPVPPPAAAPQGSQAPPAAVRTPLPTSTSQASPIVKPAGAARAALQPRIRDFALKHGLNQRMATLLAEQPKEVLDWVTCHFIPQDGRDVNEAFQRYIFNVRFEFGVGVVTVTDLAAIKAFVKRWDLQEIQVAFLMSLPTEVLRVVMSKYTQLDSELPFKNQKFRQFARLIAVDMGYPQFAPPKDGQAPAQHAAAAASRTTAGPAHPKAPPPKAQVPAPAVRRAAPASSSTPAVAGGAAKQAPSGRVPMPTVRSQVKAAPSKTSGATPAKAAQKGGCNWDLIGDSD